MGYFDSPTSFRYIMDIPDTHLVLLKSMLQYELDNYVCIQLKKRTDYKSDEYRSLLDAQGYLVKRIKELS